jgi:hypothetical protein
VVECAGLEIRYTVLPYRGFESLLLRQPFLVSTVLRAKEFVLQTACQLTFNVRGSAGCLGERTRNAQQETQPAQQEDHCPARQGGERPSAARRLGRHGWVERGGLGERHGPPARAREIADGRAPAENRQGQRRVSLPPNQLPGIEPARRALRGLPEPAFPDAAGLATRGWYRKGRMLCAPSPWREPGGAGSSFARALPVARRLSRAMMCQS